MHSLRQGGFVMKLAHIFGLSAGLALAVAPLVARAEPAGRITGLGGLFVRSKDPKALAAWYKDVLGIPLESWGGAMLKYDAPGHPEAVVWSAFPDTTDYMAPSTREFMINFAVDDLDAFLTKLKAKGVAILKRDDSDPHGSFAWIVDPDGTKIELYQPKG
jgi:catechol 2,3-dioxygenase-like lactoylglutathione lyase family enzyme